ncbi:hypothetical protein ACFSFY_12270 [Sporosarcina siberiensis]|uniref:PH domain-containing protein n=1 Tax=Sporosarcina siberiensis TaxID=1365606 RepID=A0ABW4SHP8_9BACL
MNQTVEKNKKIISYVYLLIFTVVSEIYLFTKATPYEAINELRFYCYIGMAIFIIGWLMLQNYKSLWINVVITSLILCLVLIQNYNLPELRYEDAQKLIKEQYHIIPEMTHQKVIWSDKGTDLYLVTGTLNGEKRFFSVNPMTKEIGELENPETS